MLQESRPPHRWSGEAMWPQTEWKEEAERLQADTNCAALEEGTRTIRDRKMLTSAGGHLLPHLKSSEHGSRVRGWNPGPAQASAVLPVTKAWEGSSACFSQPPLAPPSSPPGGQSQVKSHLGTTLPSQRLPPPRLPPRSRLAPAPRPR